ncbi:MAG: condensation domain-containing protein, partial [Cyanobacteriota bacterium]|nr:condensation domain-containing protein [Cyanobacteriota bacterium]
MNLSTGCFQDKLNINSTAVDFDPFAEGEVAFTAPATESQKEIWASVQMGIEANLAYNESQSLRLKGELDTAALCNSLQYLVDRHEALRTTLSPDGTTLSITDNLTLEIPQLDLSNLSLEQQQQEITNQKKQAVEQPFYLEHCPLFRVQILKLNSQENLVILTAHHIIFDGWSWGVLITELGKVYQALKYGKIPELETVE